MMVDIDNISMVVDISIMAARVVTLERCGAPVLKGRLSKTEAVQLAGTLKAIADPARLQLLSFVAAQPSGEACVCHLTTPLGLTQPTVSHHLKVLYDAGLLDRDRRGTWVYYRIIPHRLRLLRTALATPHTQGWNRSRGRRHPLAGPEPIASVRRRRMR